MGLKMCIEIPPTYKAGTGLVIKRAWKGRGLYMQQIMLAHILAHLAVVFLAEWKTQSQGHAENHKDSKVFHRHLLHFLCYSR